MFNQKEVLLISMFTFLEKSKFPKGVVLDYAKSDNRVALIYEGRTCAYGICDTWAEADVLESILSLFPHAVLGHEVDVIPREMILVGTPFQLAVWKAMIAIPKGTTVSYQEIATSIGHPLAVRAVGTAIGHNPISIHVPCHRVIRTGGGLGGYLWGLDVKRALLREEGLSF